ncbi:S-DNA-T family DNA segregation ATPase FtsK/SpoIIIE [Nonomuraea fuscirosea]|uniref:S-DNA-T family DNA segregation ATPase FtsK/SpoIIIE n=1 Tax=Nonomuraea fuscirosea TaxID=1291556 RepID=A0A2T0N0F8_9ACTN|nr:cell division protein FtsK [Nonomuraea fuscirosea]PRX65260.1 S-DNA-T family DNA segregation ATPase FtsK/SpoIIIE [Nonomuraea fuscirosea]
MSRHRASRHEIRRNARRMRRYGIQPVAGIEDLEFAPLAIAGIARLAWRYRSELAPLTVVASVLAGSLAMRHWFPEGWPTLIIATVIAAGALATWGRWVNLPRPIERGYAAVTTAFAGTWLTLATHFGPFTNPLPAVLGIGTIMLAVPWWAHRRRRARVQVERTLAAWPDIAQAVGLAGSRIQSAMVDLWGYRFRLGLGVGQTVEDAINAVPRLESALGTTRGGIRVQPVASKKANRADVRVIETDPHANAITWPGPSITSITQPAKLGLFEDGAPVRVPLLRRHALFAGMSGAGKSGGVNVLLGDLTACQDVILWAVDLKRGMELLPWASCIGRIATTPQEAETLLADAVVILDGRADDLTKRGERVWEPSPDRPALIIVIDEYAELASEAPRAIDYADSIARRGRAPAVNLIAATQRPSKDAMGKSAVRSQMDVRLCFRVREARDGDLVLGQGMVKAGWHPHKLDAPGKFLISSPEHDIPRRARSYLLDDEGVQATAEQHAQYRPPLDEVSAQALERAAEMPAIPAQPTARPSPRHARDSSTVRTAEETLTATLKRAPSDGVSIGDLMRETGMRRTWVYQRLQDLSRARQVEQVSRGRWRALPEVHDP